MSTKFEPQLEKLMTYFASEPHKSEVIAGKTSFFAKLGLGADDPDGYEPRMDLFFDWFLFTRPMSVNGLTPVQSVLMAKDFEINGDEKRTFENLTRTEHSLYEVLKIRDREVQLKDLFSGEKRIIIDSTFSAGFQPGQIFDGRLIPTGDGYWFCKGFCFHPAEVKTFILKEIRKIDETNIEEREDLMLRLMQMKFKVEKYRHLKLNEVYSNTTRVKF